MRAEVFRLWWKLFMQRWDRAEQKELTAFYWGELKDMPDDLFAEAARQALRGSVYFPTVEELEASVGAGGLSGIEAWEMLLPALRGMEAASPIPHEVRRVIALMGGIRSIGRSELDLPHRRREFIAMYDDLKGSEKRKQLTEGADNDET